MRFEKIFTTEILEVTASKRIDKTPCSPYIRPLLVKKIFTTKKNEFIYLRQSA